jgi:hypothetical protein
MADQGDDQTGSNSELALRKLFREKPAIAWGGTAVLVGLIAAVVVIVAVSVSESKNVPLNCTLYEHSSTLRLSFDGVVTEKEASGGCATTAKELSSAASYWVVGVPAIPEDEPREICALANPDETGTVVVEEVPSYVGHGEAVCGSLTGAGWTQSSTASEVGPGQREFIRNQHIEERQQEVAEIEEAEIREQEEVEQEKRNRVIEGCEEEAEAVEAEEIEQIEAETNERAAGAANEFKEYEIEEEGYEAEEEAYEREFEAVEACEVEANTGDAPTGPITGE